MVLIFSNDDDLTTNTVIDWILYYGGNFVRINQDDILELESLFLTNNKVDFTLIIKEKNGCLKSKITYSELQSVWFRRGRINLEFSVKNAIKEGMIGYPYEQLVIRDIKDLITFLNYSFLKKNHINSFFDTLRNKTINLWIALGCGLTIPNTYISSSKSFQLKI